MLSVGMIILFVGTFFTRGEAFSCNAGEYCSSNCASCLACSAGWSCPGDDTTIKCPVDSYSATGASSCTECAEGLFSAAGDSSCQAAGPGFFASYSGPCTVSEDGKCFYSPHYPGDYYSLETTPVNYQNDYCDIYVRKSTRWLVKKFNTYYYKIGTSSATLDYLQYGDEAFAGSKGSGFSLAGNPGGTKVSAGTFIYWRPDDELDKTGTGFEICATPPTIFELEWWAVFLICVAAVGLPVGAFVLRKKLKERRAARARVAAEENLVVDALEGRAPFKSKLKSNAGVAGGKDAPGSKTGEKAGAAPNAGALSKVGEKTAKGTAYNDVYGARTTKVKAGKKNAAVVAEPPLPDESPAVKGLARDVAKVEAARAAGGLADDAAYADARAAVLVKAENLHGQGFLSDAELVAYKAKLGMV